MLIWIPVKGENGVHSEIVPQLEAQKWALVDFDAGEMQSLKFYNSIDELGGEWVDFIVLANKFENYLDYMNEGMMVLVVREDQKTVEEIIEAFKFKELDEIGL
jgi:predicted Fe-Mo cluster-binding NifX family protein